MGHGSQNDWQKVGIEENIDFASHWQALSQMVVLRYQWHIYHGLYFWYSDSHDINIILMLTLVTFISIKKYNNLSSASLGAVVVVMGW
jgi:hypothetical protein